MNTRLLEESHPFIKAYRGQPYIEFCIAALPCYLFLVAFVIRYLAIKDLGTPKRL